MPPEIETPEAPTLKTSEQSSPEFSSEFLKERKLDTLSDVTETLAELVMGQAKATADDLEKLRAYCEQLTKSAEAKLAEAVSRRTAELVHVPGYTPRSKPDDPAMQFSFARAAWGNRNGWKGEAKDFPERASVIEATEKAQAAGVDTLGGFVVPSVVLMAEFIPALLSASVLMRSGVKTLPLTGDTEIPRMDELPDAYWVAEGRTIGKTQGEMGMVKMQEHELAAILPITNKLLKQQAAAETLFRDALLRVMRKKLDESGFTGVGQTQPVGVLSRQNVGTIDASTYADLFTNGATNTSSDFLEDMVGKLEDADAYEGKPTWFMHPKTRRKFRKIKDSTGRPLHFESDRRPEASSESAPSFYGLPYHTTTYLASGTNADLVLVNVAMLYLGEFGGLLLDSSTEAGNAFVKNSKWLRAIMSVDWALAHGQAVANATNLNGN